MQSDNLQISQKSKYVKECTNKFLSGKSETEILRFYIGIDKVINVSRMSLRNMFKGQTTTCSITSLEIISLENDLERLDDKAESDVLTMGLDGITISSTTSLDHEARFQVRATTNGGVVSTVKFVVLFVHNQAP